MKHVALQMESFLISLSSAGTKCSMGMDAKKCPVSHCKDCMFFEDNQNKAIDQLHHLIRVSQLLDVDLGELPDSYLNQKDNIK